MSNHTLMATMKPVEDVQYVSEKYNFSIGPADEYADFDDIPLTLPYIYELYHEVKLPLISFLDEFMELGDVVEVYEYWDGKKVLPESINVPHEAWTINLLQRTYNDQFGEYEFNHKNWMEEIATRTVVSNRSVTTFVKY